MVNQSFILKNTSEYKESSVAETIQLMQSSPDGLTEFEAQQRVLKFGFNEVSEKKRNDILAFLKRYWGPMPWLLEVAIILSVVLKHYLEAGIIFALLSINTVIGQIQSRGSQKALEALKKRLVIDARVLRDGNWATKEAREIVPGDIISVGLGDIIPALPVYQVFFALGYSALFTFAIDFPKYEAFKKFGL